MLHHFHHRFGDYRDLSANSKSTQLPYVAPECLQDSHYVPLPRYWVHEREVQTRLQGKWEHEWLMGWRHICRSTDERTVIATVLPRVGMGDTIYLMLFDVVAINLISCLQANMASFVFDYIARQKIGGINLNYFTMKQLPILPPDAYRAQCPWSPESQDLAHWITPRVLELVYTSWDMQPFARDCGYNGPPFAWDEERRFRLRCELDAAYFHLYQIQREDVEYIMDTFPIVQRKDEQKYGEYRTKRVILEIYDTMQSQQEVSLNYEI
jgi:hypothetical protein